MRTWTFAALAGCGSLTPTDDGFPIAADEGGTTETAAPAPGEDTATAPIEENAAPFADAGPDQAVLISGVVALDGSASADPDGDALTFAWELTAVPTGSGTTLFDETEPTPTFFADRPGDYTLRLTVSDGALFATDDVAITASAPNDDPIADAGPDIAVTVGDTAQLNGSSSFDPNDDPLSYRWTLSSAPAGSTAVLSAALTALPQLVPDREGVYVAVLEVSDASATSAPDEVLIEARAAGGGGGGTGGGGGGTDCGSCLPPDELGRRLGKGNLAGMLLLPLAFAWRRRIR